MKQEKDPTTKNKAAEVPSAVPAEWPGAFGLFKYSKAAVSFNVWTIVFLCIFIAAVGLFFSAMFDNGPSDRPIFSNAISNLITSIISIALAGAVLASVDRKKISISESFSQLEPMVYVNAIVNNILVSIIAALSLFALIVPFFFIIPRLILCQYFIIEKKLDPIEAIRASWDATKGQLGKVYGIFGVSLLFCQLIITIIGIPVAVYLLVAYSAAFALLYKYLDKEPQQKTDQEAIDE